MHSHSESVCCLLVLISVCSFIECVLHIVHIYIYIYIYVYIPHFDARLVLKLGVTNHKVSYHTHTHGFYREHIL